MLCITEVMFTLQFFFICMVAAVANCFYTLKSFRKKFPYCVFNISGDLPILWPFNLEALNYGSFHAVDTKQIVILSRKPGGA